MNMRSFLLAFAACLIGASVSAMPPNCYLEPVNGDWGGDGPWQVNCGEALGGSYINVTVTINNPFQPLQPNDPTLPNYNDERGARGGKGVPTCENCGTPPISNVPIMSPECAKHAAAINNIMMGSVTLIKVNGKLITVDQYVEYVRASQPSTAASTAGEPIALGPPKGADFIGPKMTPERAIELAMENAGLERTNPLGKQGQSAGWRKVVKGGGGKIGGFGGGFVSGALGGVASLGLGYLLDRSYATMSGTSIFDQLSEALDLALVPEECIPCTEKTEWACKT